MERSKDMQVLVLVLLPQDPQSEVQGSERLHSLQVPLGVFGGQNMGWGRAVEVDGTAVFGKIEVGFDDIEIFLVVGGVELFIILVVFV